MLLLASSSVLTWPTGGGPLVDLYLVPVDGSLELAPLGGVGAVLVLGGGVPDGDLDSGLAPFTPVDLGDLVEDLAPSLPGLGGVLIANNSANCSSSLLESPTSVAVRWTESQTLPHRLLKSPRLAAIFLS